ncbi:P-loop containing nucleoside triphosphate hydrolase protein [Auriculariales sp. MPI-PUGE-AT-0066]|nr:P-loop containing nucleoside triphosphate hydrolase protein [Auriculariales sp. MPI-PUGE-AT-0066]
MPGDIFKKRRIAVLGARSVGKSSLVIQYIEGHFNIPIEGCEYEVDIVDTAGQEEFSFLNMKHVVGTHGYALVYSVASRQSYDIAKILFDKILDLTGLRTVPCVLVGSKSDLQRREVPTAEAEKWAKDHTCAFIETSARLNENIDKVFTLCLGQIEKRYPRPGQRHAQTVAQDNKSSCIVQ